MESKQHPKKQAASDTSESREALEQASAALDAGAQSSDATNGMSGMGAGSGYDVAGRTAAQPAPTTQQPGGSHETSGLGQDTGRGSGSANAGSASNTGSGGTGGMTGVGGGDTRGGNLAGGSGSPVGHSNTMTPVAGGVAVSGGRGSDVGDADHSMADAPTGYSGGSTGGSSEQDVGGGLSGGMRSGTGSDVSGGIGGSSTPNDDPTDGSDDVIIDKSQPESPQITNGERPIRDMKRDARE